MEVEQYVENALDLYSKKDSFAAIIYLCKLDDPELTLNALAGAMKHKYWQEKDLVGTLAFARAGTHFGLQSALQYDQSDPELAHKLRSGAKGFAYDFASSAWVGWDEPGIDHSLNLDDHQYPGSTHEAWEVETTLRSKINFLPPHIQLINNSLLSRSRTACPARSC